MNDWTEEQKQRAEANRLKALEKLAVSKAKREASANALNQNFSTNRIQQKNSVSNSGFLQSSISNQNSINSSLVNFGSSKSNYALGTVNSSDILAQSQASVKKTELIKVQSNTSFETQVAHCENVSVPSTIGNSMGKQLKGSFVIFTRKRFTVDIGYHPKMIEIFKSVSGRLYDAQTKRWNFPIEYHDELVGKLKVLYPEIVFSPLPKPIVKLFTSVSETRKVPEYDLSSLHPTLLEALFPFQKEGVNFGIHMNGKVLIADDMGLGKTIQAIAILNYYKDDWPILVVAPSSVRYSWADAFSKWLPTVSDDVTVINSGKDHVTKDKVIILSYDLLTRKTDEILNRGFKSVIFDESHFLKNSKSARTKAAQLVMKKMRRIIMLTGTPALSRPIELFSQISGINPSKFSNYMDFGIRYCNGKKSTWGWDFSGSSHMEELQLLLQETVMIRRLKSVVIKQLPSKIRQIILLDASESAYKNKILSKMSQKMSSSSLKQSERRGVLLEYFHQTGITKLPLICEYIKDLLESDKKFICFAHHQIVLNGIVNAIEKMKINYIRIDGSTPSEQRKIVCDKFQFNENCKIAVLSITAANAGITLTAAHLVVFAELFWNPGILIQAEDRAHRIGQEDSVIVQYLVAKGTADDEIWPLVQRKLDILNKVGLSKDNFKNSETVDNSIQTLTIDSFFREMCDSENMDSVAESDSTKRQKIA